MPLPPKHFCTAGPVQLDIHYAIPPLERIDLESVVGMIDERKYFVVHAPRQTGKTSCLRALVAFLNGAGQYRAVYANIETAQYARDQVLEAMHAVLSSLALAARLTLNDPFLTDNTERFLRQAGGGSALNLALAEWALRDPKPICLVLDEVDALVGDSLISLLRQLRSGYAERPRAFPHSVILCGVRDVRDYRIHGAKEVITGGSAFNIKSASLRLGDFTEAETRALYLQHTTETGQCFHDDVFPLVWDLTRGQPWLVNALAQETCFQMKENRDRSRVITAEMVLEAKENIVLRRETHLDQLADKLREPRVRRVVEPILASQDRDATATEEDEQYVVDLGLIRKGRDGLAIANDIYKEVIPRELSSQTQTALGPAQQPAWYITDDGRLDMDKLMSGYQQFYRENSEIWLERFDYREAAQHLLMQAFLQRIVNEGGRIHREYGLGLRRTDLLIEWRHPGGVQRVVVELKIARRGVEETVRQGLQQTADYMGRVGTKEGHLVVFDPDKTKPWDVKVFRREEHGVMIWGM